MVSVILKEREKFPGYSEMMEKAKKMTSRRTLEEVQAIASKLWETREITTKPETFKITMQNIPPNDDRLHEAIRQMSKGISSSLGIPATKIEAAESCRNLEEAQSSRYHAYGDVFETLPRSQRHNRSATTVRATTARERHEFRGKCKKKRKKPNPRKDC